MTELLTKNSDGSFTRTYQQEEKVKLGEIDMRLKMIDNQIVMLNAQKNKLLALKNKCMILRESKENVIENIESKT